MQNFYFSVIIPIYNGEGTIREALDSVKDQTFKNYEIVVINDGSTDQTREIVEDYFKSNNKLKYKIINIDRRMGVAHARNIGIKRSLSKYIAFLDADDIWYCTKLEKVHSVINQNCNIDLLSHSLHVKKGGVVVGNLFTCSKIKNLYAHLLLISNCVFTSATVVKKENLEKIGLFSENLHGLVNDYDCWLRLALQKEFKYYFFKDFLGEYRISDKSIYSDTPRSVNELMSLVRYHYKGYYQPKTLLSQLLLLRRESSILHEGGTNAYFREKTYEALCYFIQSLCKYPLRIRTYFSIVSCCLQYCKRSLRN